MFFKYYFIIIEINQNMAGGILIMVKEDRDAVTGKTIKLAVSRAKELGIRKIVVASCGGSTARMLVGSGLEIICVTHQIGFNKPDEDEMPEEVREELTRKGVKLLTATHLMGGIDRALRMQFGGVFPSEIVSTSLRMLGQGLKVCVEVSIMAADAGLARQEEDLIAIGGTGKGADTAAIIYPYHSQHFFKTKIREIIYKPYDF